MNQLIAVIISFLCIPVLNNLKLKLSYTLLISAGILGIISGMGIEAIIKSILMVFVDSSSRSTIITILMISILGGLMKHYRIFDKIVDIILLIIPNKKHVLIIIPAMMGILIMPGGALLSAPFINNIGEELGISPPRRAAINLVFRHTALFLLPYSTSLLIISATLPNINIFKVIFFNLLFVIPMIILGYKLYISDIKCDKTIRHNNKKNIFKLALLVSPIYISVIVNAFTGLPLYATLIISIVIVYALSDKRNFFESTMKSINFKSILTVIDILIIKEMILNMNDLIVLFNNLFYNTNNLISFICVFLTCSIFFGVITGNQSASLAIILPMISHLDASNNLLYTYIYFISASAFLGYFFSPIHLCQAFTLQVMNITTAELYKEYKFFAPLTLLTLFGSFITLYFLFH